MAVGRRGFLASLFAALVAPRLLPFRTRHDEFVEFHKKSIEHAMLFGRRAPHPRGLEHFIRANVWDVGPPLTEARFRTFLDEAMR